MAAPTCRVLASCRLFERLVPSAGSASITSRLHTAQNHGRQTDLSRCPAGRALPFSCQGQSVCGSAASPVYVPHRHVTWYADKKISRNLGAVGVPDLGPDFTPITDEKESRELTQLVNSTLERGEQGRLFALVAISNVQRKVTVEDVVVIETEFSPTVGDRIRLEKVLLVGGRDFTLLGQPLLSREQVCVEATVIEKTLSHNRIWSTYKPRKRYRKMKLFRNPQSMLVINKIEVSPLPVE